MKVLKPNTSWEVDESAVVTPWRNYKVFKSQRNKSMPDMKELYTISTHRPKPKLKYNKWFIKPELRLKTSIVDDEEQNEAKHFKEDFVYQSLYRSQEDSAFRRKPKKIDKGLRSSCAEQLCSDSLNVKMLAVYKHKKQLNSKRVPGIIQYLIRYNIMQEQSRKQSTLPRRVIF